MGYSSDFGTSDVGFLSFILGFGLVLMLVLFVVSIVLYLLHSIGLYKMAKNLGIENPWFAFIPVLHLYTMGMIVRKVKFQNFEIPQLEIVLPVSLVASMILSMLPFIGALIPIAYLAFYYFVLYYFYKKYKGDKAVVMTILSFFLFFMEPIYFFMMRDQRPIE